MGIHLLVSTHATLRPPSDDFPLVAKVALIQVIPEPVTNSPESLQTQGVTEDYDTGTDEPQASISSPMLYIFDHESGDSTSAINPSSGACGLGQAWPCSKMPCSLSVSDYSCQVAYFTQYADDRYGGWANAAAYWSVHHNW